MSVELSKAEQDLQDRARRFASDRIRPNAMEYVRSGEWPWELFEAAAEEGLVGRMLPAEYGGHDGSLVERCLVAEEFCRADSSVGLALHAAPIGTYAVEAAGSPDLKERLLPPMTSGEATTGIALTEPDTGSALSEATTTAERDGDEWVISGEKKWIANGLSADWIATLCRTSESPGESHRGLSLIVVPTDADGYEPTELDKLGMDAAEHARITYDDVRVPAENLVGEEGQGFYYTLEWLEHGRVDIAAAHLGIAQGAYDRALAYAEEREQGGQPIGDYQGLRWKLVDMKTSIEVARAQTYRAARLVDASEAGEDVDENPIEQASIAKLFSTEVACDVAEEAVQILGGNGYQVEYEVEHFFRDAKAGTIYEGTSEVQRNTIGKVIFDEF